LKPTLDIIIVNWNTGAALDCCLASLSACDRESFLLQRIVVVDNASKDGSADHLDSHPLPLVLIKNPDNRGFAAACNQGAAGSTADYLLFLNPDTRLHTNSLQQAVTFLEAPPHRSIGICGGQALDENGFPALCCARFPSLRIFFGKMIGLEHLFPGWFPSHQLSPADLRQSRNVDQIIGAFFFTRKKLWDQLGGFDPRFFVYFEEVDFSLRAQQAGSSSFFLKECVYVHEGAVSSAQVKPERLFYSLRSRLQYGFKHFTPVQAWGLLLMTLTLECGSRLFLACVGKSEYSPAEVLAGYWLVLKNLDGILLAEKGSKRAGKSKIQ
jgi:GT2 family glycosyltransferase